ncbi:hypothetical protein QZH41_014460, partial [Actinostola sp. cb2023]
TVERTLLGKENQTAFEQGSGGEGTVILYEYLSNLKINLLDTRGFWNIDDNTATECLNIMTGKTRINEVMARNEDDNQMEAGSTGDTARSMAKFGDCVHAVIFVVQAHDKRLKEGTYLERMEKIRDHFRFEGHSPITIITCEDKIKNDDDREIAFREASAATGSPIDRTFFITNYTHKNQEYSLDTEKKAVNILDTMLLSAERFVKIQKLRKRHHGSGKFVFIHGNIFFPVKVFLVSMESGLPVVRVLCREWVICGQGFYGEWVTCGQGFYGEWVTCGQGSMPRVGYLWSGFLWRVGYLWSGFLCREWVTCGQGFYGEWVTCGQGFYGEWVTCGQGFYGEWVTCGQGFYGEWVTCGQGFYGEWVTCGQGFYGEWVTCGQGFYAESGLSVVRVSMESGLPVVRVSMDSGLPVVRVFMESGLPVVRVSMDSGLPVVRVFMESGLPVVRVSMESGLPVVRVSMESGLPVVRVSMESGLPVVRVSMESGLPVVRVSMPRVGYLWSGFLWRVGYLWSGFLWRVGYLWSGFLCREWVICGQGFYGEWVTCGQGFYGQWVTCGQGFYGEWVTCVESGAIKEFFKQNLGIYGWNPERVASIVQQLEKDQIMTVQSLKDNWEVVKTNVKMTIGIRTGLEQALKKI